MNTITTSKGTLTLLSPATLRESDPKALAEYLSNLEATKQALEVDLSVSQSRLEDFKAKLAEVQATAQKEFGVSTVEELSKIRDNLLLQIEQALTPSLTSPTQQPAVI